MATVLNVPKDTRFGDLGRGFGNVLQGFLDEKDETEKAEANKQIIDSLLLELGLEDVPPDLAEALSSREADLDIPTQLQLLSAVKQQSDQRRIEEGVDLRNISAILESEQFSRLAAIDKINIVLSALGLNTQENIAASRGGTEGLIGAFLGGGGGAALGKAAFGA